ncbi:unnamed protein product [Strongylus vulgaris]|uniref:Uncharacterized protein n=1 Tax=Strongylus vulgaris TaxID=40348 RepID=A0A3P7I4X1_STRVU|nr:unnamed protein product [Strongylus vulgaris]
MQLYNRISGLDFLLPGDEFTHFACNICWRYSMRSPEFPGSIGDEAVGGSSGGLVGSDGDDDPDTEPERADETM